MWRGQVRVGGGVGSEGRSVGRRDEPIAQGVGFHLVEELLSIRQPSVEQIGLAVTPGQEIPVALDARVLHWVSIPLTIVVTYRLN